MWETAVLRSFSPGCGRLQRGQWRKQLTAMGSCRAPAPAWFLALTGQDPVAQGGGWWFPPPCICHNITWGLGRSGRWTQHQDPSRIPAKEGLPRRGPGSGRPRREVSPFPALSGRVGPSAGGHRRELGSFLHLLLGGQWPGVGDSHPGPGCELLLGARAAPHGQTAARGTQDVSGMEQETGWSGGGCLHPQRSPHLISSSWWAMSPRCRRAAGAVACSHMGNSRAW